MSEQWGLERWLRQAAGGGERLVTGAFDGLGRIFEHGTDALALVGIPLADAVVSIVAARVLAESLNLPLWLGYAAGFAMEAAGVLAAKVPLRQHFFNQGRDKADGRAPAWLGWTTFAVQTAFSAALIVLNAAGPNATLFGMTLPVVGTATLSVQSLAATVAMALNGDIRHREEVRTRRLESERRERERAKAERRAERQKARAERVSDGQAAIPDRPALTERQAAIVQYVAEHPFSSLNEIAEAVGTSKTTVHGELAAVGAKKNSHGWEVT